MFEKMASNESSTSKEFEESERQKQVKRPKFVNFINILSVFSENSCKRQNETLEKMIEQESVVVRNVEEKTKQIEENTASKHEEYGENHILQKIKKELVADDNNEKEIFEKCTFFDTEDCKIKIETKQYEIEKQEENCKPTAEEISIKSESYEEELTETKHFLEHGRHGQKQDTLPTQKSPISNDKEPKFKCQHCGKPFIFESHFKRHAKIHGNKRDFVCDLCGKGFTENRKLKMHVKTVHERKHSELKFESGSNPFINGDIAAYTWHCSVCSKGFFYKSQLTRHEKIHTRKKTSILECEFCNIRFLKKDHLAAHLISKHNVTEKKCSCLQNDFRNRSQPSNLAALQLNYCRACPKGGFRYRSQTPNLVSPQPNRASPREDRNNRPPTPELAETQLKCKTCSKVFKWKSHLQRHERYHAKDKQYACVYCDLGFVDKANMNRHLTRAHGFERGKIEAESKVKRPREARKKLLECFACPKRFGHKSHLESHERMHKDEKMFGCEVCGKRFVEKGNMKRHLKARHEIVMAGVRKKEKEECIGFAMI